MLAVTFVIVMAEEFNQFPDYLQDVSRTLVHNRNCRTAFICGVIILMAITSSITIIGKNRCLALSELNGHSKIYNNPFYLNISVVSFW